MVDELAATRHRAWYVRSSVSLEGTVSVAGAKNSTTRLMIAACLAEGPSEFDNVPSIADAKITAAMLEACGCPKSCRGWSGGMFVFVDQAIAAGRSDGSKGRRVVSRVVVGGGVSGWSLV